MKSLKDVKYPWWFLNEFFWHFNDISYDYFFLFTDEPINSVLEDLKSLTSAVLKDDISSSESEDWVS